MTTTPLDVKVAFRTRQNGEEVKETLQAGCKRVSKHYFNHSEMSLSSIQGAIGSALFLLIDIADTLEAEEKDRKRKSGDAKQAFQTETKLLERELGVRVRKRFEEKAKAKIEKDKDLDGEIGQTVCEGVIYAIEQAKEPVTGQFDQVFREAKGAIDWLQDFYNSADDTNLSDESS